MANGLRDAYRELDDELRRLAEPRILVAQPAALYERTAAGFRTVPERPARRKGRQARRRAYLVPQGTRIRKNRKLKGTTIIRQTAPDGTVSYVAR